MCVSVLCGVYFVSVFVLCQGGQDASPDSAPLFGDEEREAQCSRSSSLSDWPSHGGDPAKAVRFVFSSPREGGFDPAEAF